MTCADVRERLLEADLTDLDPADGGPTALHLRECAACRADAARIVEAHAALAAARSAPGRVEAPVAAARALDAVHEARRRRRRRLVIAPLMAAAAAVAVLLARHDPIPGTPAVPVAHMTPPPLVESAGARVAVITTRRPDITVVWQF